MTWGNGNKGPWGKPSQPQPETPQNRELEELLRRSQDKFKGMMQGGGSGKKPLLLGLMALLVLWLGSGIYRVNSDELGVVLRFGKYHRTTSPGLNYHLPYPVEMVLIPSVTSINKVEVGNHSGASDPTLRQARMMAAQESAVEADKGGHMLTGDRNIVDIDFEVQWKIDSAAAQDYLFNVRNPAGMVRPVAESAMRDVVGRHDLEAILTTAQSQISDDTRELMQEMLDSYKAGIEIVSINISKPDVPGPVIDEFQDVKRAEQEKATAESVAEGYRNDIIPKAKGEGVKMQQDALAYKNQVIADAEGNASRFLAVYNQYKQAKDVTKRRMYLETMEEVFGGMNKMVVDEKGGVLPYLPLDSLKTKATKPAPAAQEAQ